ncbi:MAG: hypothetical protein V1754_11755 [Pseudomonadota bacterium]
MENKTITCPVCFFEHTTLEGAVDFLCPNCGHRKKLTVKTDHEMTRRFSSADFLPPTITNAALVNQEETRASISGVVRPVDEGSNTAPDSSSETIVVDSTTQDEETLIDPSTQPDKETTVAPAPDQETRVKFPSEDIAPLDPDEISHEPLKSNANSDQDSETGLFIHIETGDNSADVVLTEEPTQELSLEELEEISPASSETGLTEEINSQDLEELLPCLPEKSESTEELDSQDFDQMLVPVKTGTGPQHVVNRKPSSELETAVIPKATPSAFPTQKRAAKTAPLPGLSGPVVPDLSIPSFGEASDSEEDETSSPIDPSLTPQPIARIKLDVSPPPGKAKTNSVPKQQGPTIIASGEVKVFIPETPVTERKPGDSKSVSGKATPIPKSDTTDIPTLQPITQRKTTKQRSALRQEFESEQKEQRKLWVLVVAGALAFAGVVVALVFLFQYCGGD